MLRNPPPQHKRMQLLKRLEFLVIHYKVVVTRKGPQCLQLALPVLLARELLLLAHVAAAAASGRSALQRVTAQRSLYAMRCKEMFICGSKINHLRQALTMLLMECSHPKCRKEREREREREIEKNKCEQLDEDKPPTMAAFDSKRLSSQASFQHR